MAKKAAITANLLKKEEKAPVTSGLPQRGESTETVGLNFTVTKEFRNEYKAWCAQNGLKMVDVLERSFRLFQEQHGGD